VISKRRN